jgi:hypothetical protein
MKWARTLQVKRSEATSGDDPRQLWCLLESKGVIIVNVKANDRITTLKERVYKKGGSVAWAISQRFVLFKVSGIMDSGSSIYVFFVRSIYLSMGTVPQIL